MEQDRFGQIVAEWQERLALVERAVDGINTRLCDVERRNTRRVIQNDKAVQAAKRRLGSFQSDLVSVGQRLQRAREQAGLTQAQLAAVVGKRPGKSTISAIETGKVSARFEDLQRFAHILNVEFDWLLNGPKLSGVSAIQSA